MACFLEAWDDTIGRDEDIQRVLSGSATFRTIVHAALLSDCHFLSTRKKCTMLRRFSGSNGSSEVFSGWRLVGFEVGNDAVTGRASSIAANCGSP